MTSLQSGRPDRTTLAVVLGLIAAKALVHLVLAGRYGPPANSAAGAEQAAAEVEPP